MSAVWEGIVVQRQRRHARACMGSRLTARKADEEGEQDDRGGVLPVCVVRRVGEAQVEVRKEGAKQANGVRAPCECCAGADIRIEDESKEGRGAHSC